MSVNNIFHDFDAALRFNFVHRSTRDRWRYSGRTLDGEAATPLDLRSALQLCVWTGCAGVVCNDDECVARKLDSDCNLVTPDANYSRDNGNVTAYLPSRDRAEFLSCRSHSPRCQRYLNRNGHAARLRSMLTAVLHC